LHGVVELLVQSCLLGWDGGHIEVGVVVWSLYNFTLEILFNKF
jgi:hypothetical protein